MQGNHCLHSEKKSSLIYIPKANFISRKLIRDYPLLPSSLRVFLHTFVNVHCLHFLSSWSTEKCSCASSMVQQKKCIGDVASLDIYSASFA